MVLEFFIGYYIENVDVFFFGLLFFVILEWDFIVVDGKMIYGIFVENFIEGKVGFGFVMEKFDCYIKIVFLSYV